MIEKFSSATYVIYKMRMASPTNFINYNYLIVDRETRAAAIVDPAWRIDLIAKLLADEGATLQYVLLTHSHFDHINLAAEVARTFRCSVLMHAAEIRFYDISLPNLLAIEDGQEIWIGATRASCIATPGHTRGGCCYLLADSLITGDTLFNEGCGVCHLHGGSAHDMFHSLQKLKQRVGDDIRIFPGHSFGTELGQSFEQVKHLNIYLHIKDVDGFVKFRMRGAQSSIFNFS